MIRQIAVIQWKDETTAEQITEADRAIRLQIESSDVVESFAVGPNLRPGTGRGDYAVVVDFLDMDSWHRFDEHPLHAPARDALLRYAKSIAGIHVEF